MRRSGDASPTALPGPRETAAVRQAAGLLLDYPDSALRGRLPLIVEALAGLAPHASRDAALEFASHAAATPDRELAEHYVAVFDQQNRRCLHLTWWTDGDTRRRGMALVRLKERYRAAGWSFDGTADTAELPDFLPAVLEFAAREPRDGTALLAEHRPGLELLRIALTDAGTPYARLLDAVCATLPGPTPADEAQARALALRGPGREDVGLEPYGPMPGPAAPGRGVVDLPFPTTVAGGPR
ncbi:nitrate reductase molybdenum cofactor assembly chaperone [Yinghuangia sp. YIM S09857]|uniref:nitrate reductase molybdenum cofactor assembly chaperone n=1 Tax=Yinghuangia sp. YIM S09857 TaxID=3436929 RepID=UPI003F52E791